MKFHPYKVILAVNSFWRESGFLVLLLFVCSILFLKNVTHCRSTVFQKMATYPLIFRQHKVDPMGIKLKAKETWAGMEMGGMCMGGVGGA